MAEVRKALSGDILRQQSLPKILESAEIADHAFQQFQAMQTRHDQSAASFSNAKTNLRCRLEGLRGELDTYLAGDYGVQTSRTGAYRKWQRSHQPFHWFVEFYGIMERGGFDVIIGNPPYLEANEVAYAPSSKAMAGIPIHAMCLERCLSLGGTANMSMILPLSLVSTQRMRHLQQSLEAGRDCWYSNFAWRPAKLFDTVNRALSIFVTAKPRESGETFTTGYLKWNSKDRDHLMPTVRHARCERDRAAFWVPKVGDDVEASILAKVLSAETTMGDFIEAGRSSRSSSRLGHRPPRPPRRTRRQGRATVPRRLGPR